MLVRKIRSVEILITRRRLPEIITELTERNGERGSSERTAQHVATISLGGDYS